MHLNQQRPQLGHGLPCTRGQRADRQRREVLRRSQPRGFDHALAQQHRAQPLDQGALGADQGLSVPAQLAEFPHRGGGT